MICDICKMELGPNGLANVDQDGLNWCWGCELAVATQALEMAVEDQNERDRLVAAVREQLKTL